MCGPHHCPGRDAFASGPEILRRLLQLRQNASILEQGCAGFSPGSANRCDQFTRHPGRTSSPLRPRLSCRYTQDLTEALRRSVGNPGAEKAAQEVEEGVGRAEGNADADRRQEAGEGGCREEALRQAAAEVGLVCRSNRAGVYSRRSEPEILTGPATSRKDGTHAVFQVAKVDPHSRHSKLAICRDGAMASMRL